MSSDFLIWQYRSVPGAAIFTELRGFEDIFRFDTGQPLRAEFPGEAAFHMNPDFPNDQLLADNVGNSLQTVLVSARLQKAVVELGLGDVESLPVSIFNHKGRLAGSTHVIVHPVGWVDCIDLAQSAYKPHRIVKGKIDKVTKLVIDSQRVPADRQVFKLKGFSTPVVVRRAFAEALTQGRFSGLEWQEVEDYPKR
jgi:hypothetical protein